MATSNKEYDKLIKKIDDILLSIKNEPQKF